MDLHLTFCVQTALFRREGPVAQDGVHGSSNIVVDHHVLAVLNLDQNVERRRRPALEDALLCAAPPRLLVGEGHRFDAAHEVAQRRVHEQVVQVVAVGRADELHAALGDGARAATASNSRPISSMMITSGM